jgi:hypothetical protein
MKIDQTSDLIKVPNRIIERLATSSARRAITLTRGNKFGEPTLPDKTSKTNITHTLERLLVSVSRRTNVYWSTYGRRLYMSVIHLSPNKLYLHTLNLIDVPGHKKNHQYTNCELMLRVHKRH